MRGIDTPGSVLGHAHELVAEGYGFVMKYSASTQNFPNKTFSQAEVEGLHSVGIKLGLIYETRPLDGAYFSRAQGDSDGRNLVARAIALGFPKGAEIGLYWTCDFDCTESQIRNRIVPYAMAIRMVIEAAGYLPGAYINGMGGRILKKELGLIHYHFLPQSTGWGEYQHGLTTADIQQLPTKTLALSNGFKLDVDEDVLVNGSTAGLW